MVTEWQPEAPDIIIRKLWSEHARDQCGWFVDVVWSRGWCVGWTPAAAKSSSMATSWIVQERSAVFYCRTLYRPRLPPPPPPPPPPMPN